MENYLKIDESEKNNWVQEIFCTTKKIRFMFFQQNCAASFPISTFIYLLKIYIFPRSTYVAAASRPNSREFINRRTEAAQFPLQIFFKSNFVYLTYACSQSSQDLRISRKCGTLRIGDL